MAKTRNSVQNDIAQKMQLKASWLASLTAFILTACAPAINPTLVPTLTPRVIQTQTVGREAQVHGVEIQITNRAPAQVSAVVRGHLTGSCAVLGESQVEYASNTFRITVYALSPVNQGCVQTTTPFETKIALDISELPAGTYTVIANGVSAVFTLPDNSATPTSTAVPSVIPPRHQLATPARTQRPL